MIILAIICTLVAGVIGAFLEPVSFSVSLPIAVMGGFILYEIKRKFIRALFTNNICIYRQYFPLKISCTIANIKTYKVVSRLDRKRKV